MWHIRDIVIQNKVVVGPMAGVSNLAFRSVAKEFGAGLIYTEMVSDKALFYGNEKTIRMCEVDPNEHPLSLQLFGEDIETMVAGAMFLDQKTDCDIIDINMGCPVSKVVKGNGGASLLKNSGSCHQDLRRSC
jgi:tRNA-dihydrouridine synthase